MQIRIYSLLIFKVLMKRNTLICDLTHLSRSKTFKLLLFWNKSKKLLTSLPNGCLHRYAVQVPELGCYGHKEYSAGVRNYGKRDPKELFDVYCFAKELDGTQTHTHIHAHKNTHTREDIKQHQELSQLLAGLHHILLQH